MIAALHARARLRIQWRSWLAWAVVAGLAGAVPVAALAGANRAETAYDRFVDGTEAFHLAVVNGSTTPTNANRQFDFDGVRARPEVADADIVAYYAPKGVAPDGTPIVTTTILPLALTGGGFGSSFNRMPVLDGRLPEAVDEIALSPLAADNLDVSVGDVLALDLISAAEVFEPPDPDAEEDGPVGRLEVTGIVAVQSGFRPSSSGSLPPIVILSQAFHEANRELAVEILAVRLVDGVDGIAPFGSLLQELGAPDPVVSTNQSELRDPVQRGLDVQATVLRVFAAVTAAIGLLLLTQVLRRRLAVDALDDDTWRALGATGPDLRRSRMVIGLVVAPLAGLVTVATASGLSPIFPIGPARDIEVERGFVVDGPVLVLGGLVVAATVIVLHVTLAWWQSVTDRTNDRRRAARLAPLLASAGAPPTVAAGMVMAVEGGRGDRAVPVRSTVVSVGVGVAAIAGVLVFAASLQHLYDEPRLYGWSWDVQAGDPFSPVGDGLADEMRAEAAVDAVATAVANRMVLGDQAVDVLAYETGRGIEPTVVTGVAPAGEDDLLLGVRTARDLGVGVGDSVPMTLAGTTVEFEVVGEGIFPEFAGTAGLGEGAAVTLVGLGRFSGDVTTDTILVDVEPGEAGAAVVEQLRSIQPNSTYQPVKPSDLAALERLGGLPSLVALLLAVAAELILVTTLVSTVRRRAGHLATLKAIGFERWQLRAIVLWQTVLLVAVSAVVGVPVGIVGGRLLWLLFADRFGVPFEPIVPLGQIAALVALSVAVSLLVALVPARLAARLRPGPALRAE